MRPVLVFVDTHVAQIIQNLIGSYSSLIPHLMLFRYIDTDSKLSPSLVCKLMVYAKNMCSHFASCNQSGFHTHASVPTCTRDFDLATFRASFANSIWGGGGGGGGGDMNLQLLMCQLQNGEQ